MKTLVSIVLCIIGIIIVIFSYISFKIALNLQKSNINIKDTDGVESQIFTGNITDDSLIEIDIPTNPRDILDYQMAYGTGGIDYIVASPTNQPNLNNRSISENNAMMHNYLHQYRLNFNINDISREGYIMFITTFPIKKTSDIFIGLDGKTIGRLDKSKKLAVSEGNEFLYKLSDLKLIGNNSYHFSKNLSNQKNISINAVIGESGNYVEKIIIFFK